MEQIVGLGLPKIYKVLVQKNVSILLSHPSSPIDWALLSSQGQYGHLQFENVVN
jgi:hypothetical protein